MYYRISGSETKNEMCLWEGERKGGRKGGREEGRNEKKKRLLSCFFNFFKTLSAELEPTYPAESSAYIIYFIALNLLELCSSHFSNVSFIYYIYF